MYKRYAIIVAGGAGRRMGSSLPKQYLLLAGKPVLMHTISQFVSYGDRVEIVVVIHPDMEQYWQEQCEKYDFDLPHHLVFGGESRFQSVKRGVDFVLEKLGRERGIVSIHDAARPLITPTVIAKAFHETEAKKATVVAIPSVNSIREGNVEVNRSIDRTRIWMVQTPQTFTADLLQEAFKQEESSAFTDDASVVERLGQPIHIIEGDYRNIKITYPEDIAIAQLYMDNL